MRVSRGPRMSVGARRAAPLRAVGLALALLLALALAGAARADLTDYDYQTPISITNDTGAALANTPVALTVNADSLVDYGYVQVDGDDVQGADSDGTELHTSAQGMGSSSVTWWLNVPTLADGSTATYYLHTGDSGATRDQSWWLDGDDDVTVTNHSDFAITDNLTLEATVTWDASIGSNNYIVQKANQWELYVSNTGILSCRLYPITLIATATLLLDEETRIKCTYANPELKLYLDDVLQDTENSAQTLTTNSASISIGFGGAAGFKGLIDDVKVGTGSVVTPTYVLDLDFEPQDLAETQVGDAGNSWTYTGTVEDVSAGTDQDGTYSLTRDMSAITRWVQAVELKVLPDDTTVGETIRDVIGDVTIPPQATVAAKQFVFRSIFEAPAGTLGVTTTAYWWFLLAIPGALIGWMLYRMSGGNSFLFGLGPTGMWAMGFAVGVQPWWIVGVGFLALCVGVPQLKRMAT